MRVIQVTQRFSPALGGVEDQVMNLASRLTEAGVTTEVFATDLLTDIPLRRLGNGGPPFSFTVRRFRAVKILDLPHGLGIVAPSMFPGVLAHRPDLIHAHAYGHFATVVGSLARLFQGIPLVVTPHSDPGRPSLAKRFFDFVVPALTLRPAQRVIALTRVEAEYLRGLGVAEERIRVIPNGVNLGEFEGMGPRLRPGGPPTLLFVGRCYPQQKGLEYLVRAMALLPPHAGARLRIVGEDWGGAAQALSLARALGVGDRVTYSGPLGRGELLQAYAEADILVLPSLFEPFGIVLLEAMATGLPVVASRVGGVPEVMEDGKTGFLVQPGNARALAEALDLLLSDPALRRRMGRAGRIRAAEYSWDRILPQVLDVYHEAIVESGQKRAG